MSLSSLFLVVFFDFFHFLGQRYSIFCSLLLVFLSILCLERNILALWVLWSKTSYSLFLTAYWQTSSPLERLKSFQIRALSGCSHRDKVVSVSPGIPFSPLSHKPVGNAQTGICGAPVNRLGPLSSSPWSVTRMLLTAMGLTLSVIPTTDSNHRTLPLFPQNISSYFYGPVLLLENTELLFVIFLNKFLAAGSWEEDI